MSEKAGEISPLPLIKNKAAEEQLGVSEKFLGAVFDSIQDPIMIVDSDYRVIRVNEAYAQLRNISAADIRNTKCFMSYQRDSVCEQCIVEKTFRSKDPCAKDKLIRDPDGSEKWIEILTYPLYGEKGEVTHVMEYVRDVTDRRRGERALQLAYLELDQIFNTAADGMWVVDKEFNVLRFNKVFLSLSGLKAKDINGKKCHEVLPCAECGGPQCPLRRISDNREKIIECESDKTLRDGRTISCLVKATAFHGPDGELIGIVENFKDITERKQMERELERLATTDRLTQVYNRMKFEEVMAREVDVLKRYKRPLSVIMLDIDKFKDINDRHGHAFGDYVLKVVSHIIKGQLRGIDYIVRWGGEEFIIIAPDTELQKAVALGERIRKAIDKHHFERSLNVTASFGVSQYRDADDVDSCIGRADEALYKAKENGRNRVEVESKTPQ